MPMKSIRRWDVYVNNEARARYVVNAETEARAYATAFGLWRGPVRVLEASPMSFGERRERVADALSATVASA